MSFTRSMYDGCSCRQSTDMSVAPMNYRLYDGQYVNCKPCFATCSPYNAENTASTLEKPGTTNGYGDVVQIDSILNNRVKPFSECDEVPCNTKCFKNLPNVYNKASCAPFLESQDTRFTHPLHNYRGMQIDRFQYLPIDAQCNIYANEAINTRQLARDTYRIIIPDLITDEVTPKPQIYQPMSCGVKCNKINQKK
ncbi:hypothetical protein CPAV1605_655 [seawater metagenome]|uniref:Uncharacterized protein n=1 Tax=seawater metagenome TaxID=1561972 RepID=A0A5E8CM87_9ZZZZ